MEGCRKVEEGGSEDPVCCWGELFSGVTADDMVAGREGGEAVPLPLLGILRLVESRAALLLEEGREVFSCLANAKPTAATPTVVEATSYHNGNVSVCYNGRASMAYAVRCGEEMLRPLAMGKGARLHG